MPGGGQLRRISQPADPKGGLRRFVGAAPAERRRRVEAQAVIVVRGTQDEHGAGAAFPGELDGPPHQGAADALPLMLG